MMPKVVLYEIEADGRVTCRECGMRVTIKSGHFGRHLRTAHALDTLTHFLKHGGSIPTCGCGCGVEMGLNGAVFLSYVLGHQRLGKTNENDPERAAASVRLRTTLAAVSQDEKSDRANRSVATSKERGVWATPYDRMTPEQVSKKNKKSMQTRVERGTAPEGFKRCKRGWYESPIAGNVYHHCGWELDLMQRLDRCTPGFVAHWARLNWKVDYEVGDGSTHGYYPDFGVLFCDAPVPCVVELKGARTDKDGFKIAAALPHFDALGVAYLVIEKFRSRYVVAERNDCAAPVVNLINEIIR